MDSSSDTDQRDLKIIRETEKTLDDMGVTGVVRIGPVSPDGSRCDVLLQDVDLAHTARSRQAAQEDLKLLPANVTLSRAKGSPVFHAGPGSRPWQFPGPAMGGDPIWNDLAIDSSGTLHFGTITFAAGPGGGIKIQGYACDNQCITCDHVLNMHEDTDLSTGAGTSISTTRNPSQFKLRWFTDPFNTAMGGPWIDVAGAEASAAVAYTPFKIRGLEMIKGAVQPTKGSIVLKYGAKTGLTAGLDLGIAKCLLDEAHQFRAYVRVVSGYFSDEGDSGAAVVSYDRKLVGIVVSGQRFKANENYYIQAVPQGEALADPALSAFTIAGL